MRYKKKPVVIDAMQFDGDNHEAIYAWVDSLDHEDNGPAFDTSRGCLLIQTLEGTMRASPGDWIIRGVSGEYYPCKPDIFTMTYEEVKCKESEAK